MSKMWQSWMAGVDEENYESYEESENRDVADATVDGLKLKITFKQSSIRV